MGAALPDAPEAPNHGLFNQAELIGHESRSFHAYIHVPFCTVRCGYCDFNTYTATELGDLKQSDYAKTLISEIAFSSEVLEISGAKKREVATVFFGGGTPTLLPAVDLIVMLQSLRNQFGISDEAEITVEANPDTVSEEKLSQLREAGFNRVSIGMQSADAAVLRTLERTHSPDNVAKAVAIAKSFGFQTSVDLIYGAPGESIGSWQGSLDEAITLEPDHISAYALIVEDGTKLSRMIASGKIPPVDEDLQAEKYELTDRMLGASGYNWYEISNWSKTLATRSKHNLAYWLGQDWWGYGPGAHSHLGSVRWWNQKHPRSYAKRLESFSSPAQGREQLDNDAITLERVLLESRLADGLAISELLNLNPAAKEPLKNLVSEGLVEQAAIERGKLILSLKGRLLADAVVRRLTN